MDYYNSKAEAANFAFYNPTPTYKQIDLHGLYVAEAMARVEKHMEDCKRAGIARTRFITGKGNRSKDNIPKIKIAVLNYLKQQGVKIEPGMEEQGSVIAILDENAPEPGPAFQQPRDIQRKQFQLQVRVSQISNDLLKQSRLKLKFLPPRSAATN